MATQDPQNQIPIATIRSSSQVQAQRWRTRVWWLTGLCAIIAIAVTASSMGRQGLKILVHFKEGHGLKAGDSLRYRGIEVGSVAEVRLEKDMSGVQVHIQLSPEHSALALKESSFWIERPRLRIGQVGGLETVIGAKYVGVLPSSKSDQARQTEFTGLEYPLLSADQDSTEVRVRFPAGEGLTAGDPVRYLGIDVGEVTNVELSEDLHGVSVGVRLVGSAQKLARSGTQFWIERPRLDISEVRGLDTLVAGRYLALEPPLGDAAPAQSFEGLSEPPPLVRRQGSLELELEARQRMGLVRGAPITYRGLEVGRVADVGLANDGASVTIRAIIEPEYADLVRTNSVWWSTGGIKMDANLTGVNVTVDSFTSWLRGGLSFATPSAPGDKVATGYRFGVAEKADADWLTWQPRIATGLWNSTGDGNVPLPRVTRLAATWQTTFLGFKRRQSLQTWCLPLDDGTALVPASFMKSAAEAKTPVNIEVAGSSKEIDPSKFETRQAVIQIPLENAVKLDRWPRAKQATSVWSGRTPLLIVNPEMSEPLPLDASRAAATPGGLIEINASVPMHKSLEGSAVIETTTGELLGLLVSLNNRWVIAQPPRR